MLKLKLSVLLLGLTVAVVPAQAASRDAKERAAKRACLNGDPVKGVQILTELYLSSDDPVYLYNQGRCYEQNNRYEEAIGRFREYLRKAKGASSTEKADSESARKHIADCETLLGRKVGPAEAVATTTSPTPPPPPPPPEPRPQPEPQVVSRVPVQPQPIAAADPSSRGGLRVAGIVTASVGAAGVIAGVLLNLKANSTVSDLQKRFSDSNYSSSKDYKTGSQVAYAAGAACVAGGAILYYLGVRASQATVVPVAVQGGAGAILTGVF
jgi:hypothetical protein